MMAWPPRKEKVLVVQFRRRLSLKTVKKIVASVCGVEFVEYRPNKSRICRVKVKKGHSVEEVIKAFRALSQVEYADEDPEFMMP